MNLNDINDATWVAAILALCGKDIGGAIVSADVADDFSNAYHQAAGQHGVLRKVSSSMTVDALTGSIDLGATLALGKPVTSEGLLARHTALWVLRAEKLDTSCISVLAQALDQGKVLLLATVDLHDPDAMLNARFEDRLPFRVEGRAALRWTEADIESAWNRMVLQPPIDGKLAQDLCQAAFAVGISSPRSAIQALSVARGVAALKGQSEVDESALALAARLVLGHRAQHAPPQDENVEEPQTPPPTPDNADAEHDEPPKPSDAELVLEAVKAAVPPNLLNVLTDGAGKRGAGRSLKSSAQHKAMGKRGRRIGTKRATSLAGQRLDILATLRTAAPWQPLRRKMAQSTRMMVMKDDFRVARIKERNESTAIFAVDASGSTAFQRLAEAKGAVEAVLAECYVRRDRVALISFRNKKAEILLPPTRSLERAKRALAGLPGGGGTPLAAGLDEAFALALQVRRSGGTPVLILLTDGRGNITRAGEGNRPKAAEEAQIAARLFAAEGFQAMVIDVSAEPQKAAKALAASMHASYLALPRAGALDIAAPISLALKAASA